MTRRMWAWVAVLTVLLAGDLAATVTSMLTWQPPRGSAQQSFDLDQVVGLVSSGMLAVVIALILIGGVRATRERQRYERWRAR